MDWNGLDVFWEADLGVGGSGAETVRATIAGVLGDEAVNVGDGSIHYFMAPLLIPANTRLTIRCRNYISVTTAGAAKLMYYEEENDFLPLMLSRKVRRNVYA